MRATFYSMTRRSGKTTMLINESAKTGAIIVVPTHVMASYIVLQAKKLNLKIPDPITVQNYVDILRSDGLFTEQKYLIDELQMVLAAMNVKIATIDRNCVNDPFGALVSESTNSELHSDVKVETESIPTY